MAPCRRLDNHRLAQGHRVRHRQRLGDERLRERPQLRRRRDGHDHHHLLGRSAYTAQTASDALPCGTYRIAEANAPEGYLPRDGSVEFTIENDGQVADLSSDPVHDDTIRGGVQVTKSDAELGESEAVGGNGYAAEGVGTMLSGIEFAITNASENKVLVGDA